MQTRQNEAGFTLIGMLIAVGIVAILAMIAVPKFTSAIASANTAKIQSDLSTLDTAIALYEIDTGRQPSKLEHLAEYLQDTEVKPPTGKCYLNGSEAAVPAAAYTIEDGRAICGTGNTVGAFYKDKTPATEKPAGGETSSSGQNGPS